MLLQPDVSEAIYDVDKLSQIIEQKFIWSLNNRGRLDHTLRALFA
jgi:hypothetical protein